MLACRIAPSSSKNAITEVTKEFVRIKVTAPPVEGRANKELADFLAKFFRLPKSRIKIVKGASGKNKRVVLEGMDEGEVKMKLGETR